MELLAQQVVDGIAWGSLYGALALSLVLVYRASGIVNFAQGEMAMFSAYVTWQCHQWGMSLPLAIVASMVIAFVAGALVERVLIRPLAASTSHLTLIIITLGLMLILNSAAGSGTSTPGPSRPSATRRPSTSGSRCCPGKRRRS